MTTKNRLAGSAARDWTAEKRAREAKNPKPQKAAVHCAVCGKEFIPRSSLQTSCSPECRREFTRRKERARYHNDLKHDDAWREKRRTYLQFLQEMMQADPDLEKDVKAARQRAVRKYMEKIRADPVAYEALKQQKREYMRMLRDDPEKREKMLEGPRQWYRNLTQEQKIALAARNQQRKHLAALMNVQTELIKRKEDDK
ncbi:MAG: DUF2116 family Zn-ribbon domain-containing protein [Burkholderiaceae bacterium]|jgi:predicted nucleic acid-binding Zn ribbon protein|nr:DUF2116 family Zn-ribbon domain-containing protein [Burkholderiaceae bacterium]